MYLWIVITDIYLALNNVVMAVTLATEVNQYQGITNKKQTNWSLQVLTELNLNFLIRNQLILKSLCYSYLRHRSKGLGQFLVAKPWVNLLLKEILFGMTLALHEDQNGGLQWPSDNDQ